MKRKTTDITKSPQVFLREVQLENDAKTLMNHHRLLHAWMQECRSGSPTVSVGENGWTPKYILPAHDRVVERLKQLIPGFNHETPMQASLPMLLPITLKENAVRIVKSEDEQISVVLDKDGDWMSTLAAAMAGKEIRVYDNPSKVPESAEMDVPAYHLVLMPVDEWKKEGSISTIAFNAFNKLVGGMKGLPRAIKGRALLRASIIPGMEQKELHDAAKSVFEWVLSDDPLPVSTIGGGALLSAETAELAQWGTEKFRELIIPIEDNKVLSAGATMIRAKAVEIMAGHNLNKAASKGRAMTEFIMEIAEEMKS